MAGPGDDSCRTPGDCPTGVGARRRRGDVRHALWDSPGWSRRTGARWRATRQARSPRRGCRRGPSGSLGPRPEDRSRSMGRSCAQLRARDRRGGVAASVARWKARRTPRKWGSWTWNGKWDARGNILVVGLDNTAASWIRVGARIGRDDAGGDARHHRGPRRSPDDRGRRACLGEHNARSDATTIARIERIMIQASGMDTTEKSRPYRKPPNVSLALTNIVSLKSMKS